MKVIKRDGKIVEFDITKIASAIKKAFPTHRLMLGFWALTKKAEKCLQASKRMLAFSQSRLIM